MSQQINITREQPSIGNQGPESTVRENVQDEFVRLREELNRIAHEIRMKSKGAGAEIQDTRQMLEREAKRFGAEVDEAVDRTREDLARTGRDLMTRFQTLANEIALPSS